MSQEKFRLVTRSDFDGLVCAVLLNELNLIDDIKFVHPKDMQDGKVDITARDITTNLPYVAAAHLAFDHHLSETIRNAQPDLDAKLKSLSQADKKHADDLAGLEATKAQLSTYQQDVDQYAAAEISRRIGQVPGGGTGDAGLDIGERGGHGGQALILMLTEVVVAAAAAAAKPARVLPEAVVVRRLLVLSQ